MGPAAFQPHEAAV
uniref:Uncharacterized protein n=1 Tax=Anguilla anguilla TaxID=7936 RepID=A0A0E9UPW7_ANGAN